MENDKYTVHYLAGKTRTLSFGDMLPEDRIVITSDNNLMPNPGDVYTFTATKVDFTGATLIFGKANDVNIEVINRDPSIQQD